MTYAESLIKQFLDIFDNVKPPYSRRRFNNVANRMRALLDSAGPHENAVRQLEACYQFLRERDLPGTAGLRTTTRLALLANGVELSEATTAEVR